MAEYNPEDLLARAFLLPPNQKGERHRASIKQKIIEISDHLDTDQNETVNKINFLLDVGQRRTQAIMSYNQVLEYLAKTQQEDDSLYKFRAITNHHGPLKKHDLTTMEPLQCHGRMGDRGDYRRTSIHHCPG